MSYAFLVDSIGAQDYFKIDVAEFVERLKREWPGAKVQKSNSPTHLVRWEINIKDHFILGGLHSNQETISLEGDLSLAAEIAAWYRGIVPSGYKLFFYTGARVDRPVELTEGITSNDIIVTFNK
jgi:hypothetical protein